MTADLTTAEVIPMPSLEEMRQTITEQQALVEEMDKGMKLMIEVFTNYEQRLRAMETQLGILWKDRKDRPHILRPSGGSPA